MDKKEKKKPNIILFTLLMTLLFLFITELIIYGFAGNLLIYSINYFPYGTSVISQAILAILVLIVLLIFKNGYIFNEKKESLKTGLFYGLFFLVTSAIFILIYSSGFKNVFAVLNLFLLSLLVGISEEFLCRGFLLNEFLERYGNTKKGIWFSIIVSSIIFGLMHFSNIFTNNQPVFMTITQVINAIAIGLLFALIYYKTKNIWTVVILHGLWDFSLLLSTLVPSTSATEMFSQYSIIALLFSLFSAFIMILNIIPHIIDDKPKKKTIICVSIISSIFYIVFINVSNIAQASFGETYEYDTMTLENYAITYDNYSEYKMNYNEYSFSLKANEENNLVLTNLNINQSVEIECEYLYDYMIFDNKDYYILAYIDYPDSMNTFIKYIYINKNDLSNDYEYLNTIKNNIKKYLLPGVADLVIISDYDNNVSYVAAYNIDIGMFVLTENTVSILE